MISASQAEAPERIAPADYQLVLSKLTLFAQRLGLSRPDAEELAAETVAETFTRAAAPTKAQVERPAAYLFWTTRNRVIDRRRRARVHDAVETLVDDVDLPLRASRYSQEDEAIAQLLETHPSTELVEDALRAAAVADDYLLVRIVTTWLNVAAELGRAPTSREVAPRAEVSHTSVNHALRKLRKYFPN